MEWSSLKGRGPRWFTARKTDLLYKDVTFWRSLVSFCFCFWIGNLLKSFSTQFLVVLFSLQNTSKKICLRFLSTQLFFLVALLHLLLSMIAFSYVGLLSLLWAWLFHALCLSHLPPSSFLAGLSSEQFAELGSVHLLAFSARVCSLSFLSSVSPFFGISRAVFICLVLFWGLSLLLSLFSDSVDFNYSEGSFF